MKKKSVLVIIMSLVIVALVGCNENVEAISSVDDTQPVVLEPVSEESEPVPEVVSEPEPEPEEPEVDPNIELSYGYLEVSEEWLKAFDGGTGGMGLKRDGKLYDLTWAVPAENRDKYGIGNIDSGDASPIYLGDYGDEWVINDDRFVFPSVNGDDDLAWYGKPIMTVTLIPMRLYGYTVPILQDTDKCETLTVYDNGKRESSSYEDLTVIYDYCNKSGMLKDVRLLDANGVDVFPEFRNLVEGDSYTLKWNDGTEHEEKLRAGWRYYKPTGAEAITLTGEATDDSQVAKYDFSGISPGLYFIAESYAFVEVK